jgi:peptide/nickel transport system ATP-binding protein
MVFQDPVASLTPWLTVGEIVGERLRATVPDRKERGERVAEALARVQLPSATANFRASQLSGGQCQRVAIARAIVVPPRLLLCDEPISALDVSLAAGILNLLNALRAELGLALLFVTHDVAAARYIADRIVVMRSGRVVEEGPSEEIVRTPRDPYTRMLIDAVPRPAEAVA